MQSNREKQTSVDWAQLWRWTMIAFGVVILSACRSAEKAPRLADDGSSPASVPAPTPAIAGTSSANHNTAPAVSIPSEAYTGPAPLRGSAPPTAAAGGIAAVPTSSPTAMTPAAVSRGAATGGQVAQAAASLPCPPDATTYPHLPGHSMGPMPGYPPGAPSRPMHLAGPDYNAPLPYQPRGPWAPPGIGQPWPKDEYLRDGGDRHVPAAVGRQWRAYGVDPEDTVAHFDTLDGRTLVEPSNRVQIYAPRFGAVRQVSGLVASHNTNKAGGVYQPEQLAGPSRLTIVDASTQHQQPIGEAGVRLIAENRTDEGGGVVSTADKARGFDNRFKPYENLEVIRRGVMEASEMAWLARGAEAALAWTDNQAVVIMLDQQKATAEVQVEQAQSVFTIGEPPGNPKLRVIKVASEQFANPGDELSFTIRFDNIGNQVIGNVTVIDNLTTRLELIEDSAQCSLDARIVTEPSESGSVIVRCEVTDPIEPGEGGILRFRCRVR